MNSPRVTRPDFPPGYVERPTRLLPWSHVEQRLADSLHYWLCTVRPDGRPHAVPRWGVWLDGHFYYDGSPQTRHARNLDANPHVSLHLESGTDVVIAEGQSRELGRPDPEFAARLAEAISAKYAPLGYAPTPDTWDEGGLFEFTPRQVLAWTHFADDPTKFVLSPAG